MSETRGRKHIPSRMDFQALRDHQKKTMRWTLILLFLIAGLGIGLLMLHLMN
jgi:uncharacterized membrane-anchored protein YhcB (DUF1043 family)